MFLRLADQNFGVKAASLVAYIIEPDYALPDVNGDSQSGLFWELDIRFEEGLHFWHEDIRVPNCNRWMNLAGQTVSWARPLNPNAGNWYGGGLLSGNSDILESTLRFAEMSGCKFLIQWKGTASTEPLENGTNFQLEEQLPFEINCWCVFEGVGVRRALGIDETETRKVVAHFLELSDFSDSFLTPSDRPILMPRC